MKMLHEDPFFLAPSRNIELNTTTTTTTTHVLPGVFRMKNAYWAFLSPFVSFLSFANAYCKPGFNGTYAEHVENIWLLFGVSMH